MAFDPGTGYVFWVSPDHDRVHLLKAGGAPQILPLEGKSRPQGIVLGPDKMIWVTLEGRDEVAIFDPATGIQQKPVQLARADGQGPLGPHGIAVGEDGNVWVTLRTASKIARITAKRAVTIFDLPFGKSPTTIGKSHDGRMLFSLADTPCICAITAVPRTIPDYLGLGAAAREPSADADRKSARPALSGRKLSRAERHRLHDERIRWTDARQQARLSAAAAAVSAPAEAEDDDDEASYLPGSPVPAEGKAESKGEPAGAEAQASPSAAPLSPVERLATINVYLTPRSLKHVHTFHRYGGDATKSQFAEKHSTRPRLKELLARVMEEAHHAGTLGRIKDGDDAHLTYCDLGEPVGWYNPGDGNLIPTSWIKVVMAKYRNVDENVDEHYLISMYPDLAPW